MRKLNRTHKVRICTYLRGMTPGGIGGLWRVGAVPAIAILLGTAVQASAHERDLRTLTDAAGETEISFCSRPSPDNFGFPGHAFVAFSEHGAGGPRNFRAVGHTIAPTASQPAIIFTYFGGRPVAGQQAEERYTHLKQACLTVKVDRVAYERALQAARPTLTALGFPDSMAGSLERYSLNGNDCIDFVLRVAQPLRSAGLSVSDRRATDTPAVYIRRLIDANR